jgi:hypothetical protein
MIETHQRIDIHTMALVREFAEHHGCSVEVALKLLLKTGRYPQKASEDDEADAARLDDLPDPVMVEYRSYEPANDD